MTPTNVNGKLFMNELLDASKSFFFTILVSWGIVLAFSFLEKIFGNRKEKNINKFFLNFEVALVSSVIAGLFLSWVLIFLSNIPGMGLFDLTEFSEINIVNAALVSFLLLFIDDFFFYWAHRFQHKNIFLWQEHKLHHLDEQLNATSAIRIHWLESVVMLPLRTLPLAILFKIDGTEAGIFGAIAGAWVTFIHADLKVNFGPASMFIVGPQTHRVHHSQEVRHFDKNFAAFFPLFDIIFGTYYHPARGEFPRTGVKGEKDVTSLGEAIILPFKGWKKIINEKIYKNH